MSSHDIKLEMGRGGGRGIAGSLGLDNGSGRRGSEPGSEPGSGEGGPGRNGVGALALALAVVDLTSGCTPARRRELVEAAHGASRMGVVVLLLRGEDRARVDDLLVESVTRSGLGRGGVRCEVLDWNEPFPDRHRFVPLHITATSFASLSGAGEEVLSLEAGLERLRELGRGPVFRGPDPVFRPLPGG